MKDSIEVYNLSINNERKDKLFAMLDTAELYTHTNDIFFDYSTEHNYRLQVGHNGKTNGYLSCREDTSGNYDVFVD